MADEQIVTSIVAKADLSSLVSEVHRVTASLQQLQRELIASNKSIAASTKVANNAFKDTLVQSGLFSSHFVNLHSDVDKFGKNLDAGRLKLRDYFSTFQTHLKTSRGMIRELAKEQVMLENAILQPLGRNAQGLMQYNVHIPRGLDLVKNKSQLARMELQIFNKALLEGSTSLINWGKNTQWAGRQLTVGLTVPLTMFGTQAAKAFREADQELTRLVKVYGDLAGTSAQELGKIRKEVTDTAKELSSAMGVSFKETLALAADVAATGKTGEDLIASVRETTRLAVLGEVDRQEAMKATLAIQTAFKSNTEELTESINFLNAVENQTSTTLNDLVEAIPKAGTVVKQLGGSVQDLALYLTAMREGGVPASEAANALKSGLASMINPTKQTIAVMSEFGIDIMGMVAKNAGDTTGMILDLQKALDGLDPLSKARALEQMFGKFQFARMAALFNNLNKSGSQTIQVMELMNATAGELASVASRELSLVTESASGRFRRAVESLKASLTGIGEQFLNFGTKILNTFEKIINFFNNLPEPIQKLLSLFGGLTAIAGPLIMITGVLANFFGYITKGIVLMRSFFQGTKGWKMLTPEMIAAEKAARMVEKSFYSDAAAANVLHGALQKLITDYASLRTSMATGAIPVNPTVSTVGGSVLIPGIRREVDPTSIYAGEENTRAMSHIMPRDPNNPASLMGVVPGAIPVNRGIGRVPQIYMHERLPDIEGITSVKGISTGIVAGEAARFHALMATLGMQTREEVEALKKTVNLGGTVSSELLQTFDDILPMTARITDKAATQSAAIVAELRAGTITVEQAKARILAVNAEIDALLRSEIALYAASKGRTIDFTKAPLMDQPVVDANGQFTLRDLYKKESNRAILEEIGRLRGVRTFGAPYSIQTTRMPKFNTGGKVEEFGPGKTVVSGSTSVTYDDRLANLPLDGYVLNQSASRNPANKWIHDIAPYTYASGGPTLTAAVTPGELVLGPLINRDPVLYAAVEAANNGYNFGGQIVKQYRNYGKEIDFDTYRKLLAIESRYERAGDKESTYIDPKTGRVTTSHGMGWQKESKFRALLANAGSLVSMGVPVEDAIKFAQEDWDTAFNRAWNPKLNFGRGDIDRQEFKRAARDVSRNRSKMLNKAGVTSSRLIDTSTTSNILSPTQTNESSIALLKALYEKDPVMASYVYSMLFPDLDIKNPKLSQLRGGRNLFELEHISPKNTWGFRSFGHYMQVIAGEANLNRYANDLARLEVFPNVVPVTDRSTSSILKWLSGVRGETKIPSRGITDPGYLQFRSRASSSRGAGGLMRRFLPRSLAFAFPGEGFNQGGKVPGYNGGGNLGYLYARALAQGQLKDVALPRSYLLKALGVKFGPREGGKGYEITSMPTNPNLRMFDDLPLSSAAKRVLYDSLAQTVLSARPTTLDKNIKRGFGVNDLRGIWHSALSGATLPSRSATLSQSDRMILKQLESEVASWNSTMPKRVARQMFGNKLNYNKGGGVVMPGRNFYGKIRTRFNPSTGTHQLIDLPENFPLMLDPGTELTQVDLDNLIWLASQQGQQPGIPGQQDPARTGPGMRGGMLPMMMSSLIGGYGGYTVGSQVAGPVGGMVGSIAGDIGMYALISKLTNGTKDAAKQGSLAQRAFEWLWRLPGPIKLGALIVGVGLSIKKVNDEINKHRKIVTQAFGPTEDTVEKLNLKFTTLNESLNATKDRLQAFKESGGALYASYTSAGIPGLTLTIKQLKELQQRVSQDFPDLISMFNKASGAEVSMKAEQLKAQFVAGGMSAQEATNIIYALISQSNKAAFAIKAIASEGFRAIKNEATAAQSAMKTFFDLLKSGNVDQLTASFDTLFNALQNSEQKLIGIKMAQYGVIDAAEAYKITLDRINNTSSSQTRLTEDQLNILKEQNPVLLSILGTSETLASVYAKLRLYSMGISMDLAGLSPEAAERLSTAVMNMDSFFRSSSQDSNNKNPFGKLVDKINEAKKASESADTKTLENAEKKKESLEDLIELKQKEIEAIRQEADERRRALEQEKQDEDIVLQIKKKQLEYNNALAAGDMQTAAQAQLDIQRLVGQQQAEFAKRAIDEKERQDVDAKQQEIDALRDQIKSLQDQVKAAQDTAKKGAEDLSKLEDLLNRSIAAIMMGQGGYQDWESALVQGTIDDLEKSSSPEAKALIPLLRAQIEGTSNLFNDNLETTLSKLQVSTDLLIEILNKINSDPKKTLAERLIERFGTTGKGGSWFGLDKILERILKGEEAKKDNMFAGGGYLRGPGTGTSDSIPGYITGFQDGGVVPIRVSNTEYITRSSSVSDVGVSNMDLINERGAEGVVMAAQNIMGVQAASGGYINKLVKYAKGSPGGLKQPTFNFNKMNDRIAYSMQYLINKGMTAEAAAGIVGNLIAESSVRPGAEEVGHTQEGRGIAQWGVNARWKTYQNWLKRNNKKDLYSLTNQLDFLWWEMHNGQLKNPETFKKLTDITKSAYIFMKEFERPGVLRWKERNTFSYNAYRLHTGKDYANMSRPGPESAKHDYEKGLSLLKQNSPEVAPDLRTVIPLTIPGVSKLSALGLKSGGYLGFEKGGSAEKRARKNKNLSYYDPAIDDKISGFSSLMATLMAKSPAGGILPGAHIGLDVLGSLFGRKATFGQKGFLTDLDPSTYIPILSALNQSMLQPYSEIAKGSATTGDWINAVLPFVPASFIASKAKTAALAVQAINKVPTKTRVKITPASMLRSKFEDLKKSGTADKGQLEKSRFELALKDAILASKAKGFIPIMDLPKTSYSKLYQENLNLKNFDESIPTDIDNGRYVFKFTKGELPEEPTYLSNTFLAEVKTRKKISDEFPGGTNAVNTVEVIDQAANGKQVGYITFDPISGFIRYRFTDPKYRGQGWSEYLYNKAGSFTRIRHSGALTDAGRGSAIKMGGFMSTDDVFNYGTASNIKRYIETVKKKKKIKITRDMLNLPPAPTPPYPTVARRFHPQDDPLDGVGAQFDRMLELDPRYSHILDTIRPEVKAWFENPFRRSHNFPYGPNGYVEPEFFDELIRLQNLEKQAAGNAARASRPLAADGFPRLAGGGYMGQIRKFHDWNGPIPGAYGKEVGAILQAGREGVYDTDYINALRNGTINQSSSTSKIINVGSIKMEFTEPVTNGRQIFEEFKALVNFENSKAGPSINIGMGA